MSHVKKIYEHLAETGQLDHTILVIYTDHGFEYATHERIPIIIHFPENANTGRHQNNVQIIDIRPPCCISRDPCARVDGWQILPGRRSAPDREIMSTTAGSPKEMAPPFYEINGVQVIHMPQVVRVEREEEHL